MTQARAHTVAEGQHGLYHCVTPCVRRAWLCGIDPHTRVDHEERKLMVDARIRELGTICDVGIYAYALMSNHLHVVVSVEPAAAADWKADEVAERCGRIRFGSGRVIVHPSDGTFDALGAVSDQRLRVRYRPEGAFHGSPGQRPGLDQPRFPEP